jgi:Flp pilus assembly protein CpaB
MSTRASEVAARPATTGTVTRLVRPRERQTPLVLLGVLLVAGCALAAVLITRSGRANVDVVVAAHDLQPGQPISAGDLRTTQVSTGTNATFVSAAHLGELIGQSPRGYVPSGTPLNIEMIAGGASLAPGEDIVGAVLASGAMPIGGLRPGDTVDVLVVAKSSDAVTAPPADLGRAVVYQVAPPASGSTDGTWVSLRQPTALGLQIAQAAADGTLRLALVGSHQ